MVKDLQRMGFVFGWIVFGNIADNAFDPKVYLLACSVVVGIFYVALGVYLQLTSNPIE